MGSRAVDGLLCIYNQKNIYMKQENGKNKSYTPPTLELVEIQAERGYGASWEVGDWESGGDYSGDAD